MFRLEGCKASTCQGVVSIQGLDPNIVPYIVGSFYKDPKIRFLILGKSHFGLARDMFVLTAGPGGADAQSSHCNAAAARPSPARKTTAKLFGLGFRVYRV